MVHVFTVHPVEGLMAAEEKKIRLPKNQLYPALQIGDELHMCIAGDESHSSIEAIISAIEPCADIENFYEYSLKDGKLVTRHGMGRTGTREEEVIF